MPKRLVAGVARNRFVGASDRWRRWFWSLLFGLLGASLCGCVNVPVPRVDRPLLRRTLVAPADAPLAAIARQIALPAQSSGVWPLVQAAFALDARLAMVSRAFATTPGRQRRGLMCRIASDTALESALTGLLAWKRGQPGQVGNEAAPTVATSAEIRLVNPSARPDAVALPRLPTDRGA